MNNIYTSEHSGIIEKYLSFISNPQFPCVAARAAYAHKQIRCFVAGNMACPASDRQILDFIYEFVLSYRQSKSLYHSATIIFTSPEILDEEHYDNLLWQRLQALANLDSQKYPYDPRVNPDPHSPHFSFSLMEEAFFIIGLHPKNSRITRQFTYPTIVFNPHDQFEILRQQNHYESMKQTVRNRDMKLSGSINPMLNDFGTSSEALQYSGRRYNSDWKCPLQIPHGNTKDNSAT